MLKGGRKAWLKEISAADQIMGKDGRDASRVQGPHFGSDTVWGCGKRWGSA